MSVSKNLKCLVLNSTYEYLAVTSWFDAICLVIEDKASVLGEYDDIIRSQFHSWKVPSVLILKYYVDIKKKKSNFNAVNKRNILIRDDFQCQYCGKALTLNTMTIDHVIPKCRGGAHHLENVVAACKSCNNKKSDKILSQFEKDSGCSLRKEPMELSEEQKINCLLKTVKSKERNEWLRVLRENQITLY